jgi:hypothetical protein
LHPVRPAPKADLTLLFYLFVAASDRRDAVRSVDAIDVFPPAVIGQTPIFVITVCAAAYDVCSAFLGSQSGSTVTCYAYIGISHHKPCGKLFFGPFDRPLLMSSCQKGRRASSKVPTNSAEKPIQHSP